MLDLLQTSQKRLICQNMPRKQGLLSNNPYGYKVLVTPIYEQQRITRDEMVGLPCRATQKIKARSVKI